MRSPVCVSVRLSLEEVHSVPSVFSFFVFVFGLLVIHKLPFCVARIARGKGTKQEHLQAASNNNHVKQSSPAKGSTTIAIYLVCVCCPFSSAAAHCKKKRNEEGRGEGEEYVCLPWVSMALFAFDYLPK